MTACSTADDAVVIEQVVLRLVGGRVRAGGIEAECHRFEDDIVGDHIVAAAATKQEHASVPVPVEEVVEHPATAAAQDDRVLGVPADQVEGNGKPFWLGVGMDAARVIRDG